MKYLSLLIVAVLIGCTGTPVKTSESEKAVRKVASVDDDRQYAGSWGVKLESYLCGKDFRWKIKSCEFTLTFDESFNCTAATGEFFEDAPRRPLEEPKEPYSVKRNYTCETKREGSGRTALLYVNVREGKTGKLMGRLLPAEYGPESDPKPLLGLTSIYGAYDSNKEYWMQKKN